MSFDSECVWKQQDIDGQMMWMWPRSDKDHVFETLARDWTEHHKIPFLELTKERRVVVVQAGGNCGMYPRLMANHFERVYTFEPDHVNFFCLVNNCMMTTNVIKFQAALGSRVAMGSVNQRWPSNPGAHQVVYDTGSIPILQVDKIGLDRCDFMQFDVEGQELEVLKGSENTIRKFRPVISVERAGNDVRDFLRPYGYSVKRVAKDDTIFKTSD